MKVDAQNLFSDSQAITATANSTNVIDLSSAGRDIGTGEEIYLVVSLSVAMTDAGSDSTVAVTLVTDDNAALSSTATIATIGTFPATSAAGTRFVTRLPVSSAYERYIALTYTVAGGDLTTGSVDAFLTTDIDSFTAYPNGYTISG